MLETIKIRNLKNKYENKIYNSTSCGEFKVIEYKDAKNVKIEFITTGYITIVGSGNVTSGSVKDVMLPNVYKIGYFGKGCYARKTHPKIYDIWHNMMSRCYNHKNLCKSKSYKNVTVCKSWHNFQNFAKWFEENYIEGFQLDKDLLQYGVENKVYSPDTCVFLPLKINSFLAHHQSTNTSGFTGVCLSRCRKKHRANINCFKTNKYKSLGYFKTAEQAFIVYTDARLKQCEFAKQYMRDLGHWSEEVIQKLR